MYSKFVGLISNGWNCQGMRIWHLKNRCVMRLYILWHTLPPSPPTGLVHGPSFRRWCTLFFVTQAKKIACPLILLVKTMLHGPPLVGCDILSVSGRRGGVTKVVSLYGSYLRLTSYGISTTGPPEKEVGNTFVDEFFDFDNKKIQEKLKWLRERLEWNYLGPIQKPGNIHNNISVN